MIYYIIIAVLMCLTYLEWSGKDNLILGSRNMERCCYVFVAVLLTLTAALRYQSDPDWVMYTTMFDKCELEIGLGGFERGYVFISRIFKKLFNSYYVMQFVTVVFYGGVIFNYLYKKSDKPIFTLLLFIPIAFFAVIMNAQRQALAIATIILGMRFVEKKQFLLWIITVIVAQQFHSTAIVAFPLYFTTEYNISKRYALFLFITAVIIELFGRQTILMTLQYVSRNQYLSNDLLYRIDYYMLFGIYGQQVKYGLGLATMITYLCELFVIMLYNPHKDKYMLNFLLAMLCIAAGRNFNVISRLHHYYTICGCGIIVYNLLNRIKLPSWATISKKSNTVCCAAMLNIYILFIYTTWFYGFYCVLNEIGTLTKDYFIPYKIWIFK